MLFKLARIERLQILRGLPFSNVLGLWSRHSCSSSPSSDTPRGSCSYASSCSSGPTLFFCEPVWCMCAHEWSARCPSGCLYEKVPNDNDMMHRWFNWSCSLQGSQHHPRTCKHTNHLFPFLLQIILKYHQQTHKMLQRYTKALLLYLHHI